MPNSLRKDEKIRIPGSRQFLDGQLIFQLEGQGNYTLIHFRNNPKPLLVSRTLKYFEPLLPDFIRASKSVLVNPVVIEKIVMQNAKTLFLHLDSSIILGVPKGRISAILSKLNSLSARNETFFQTNPC